MECLLSIQELIVRFCRLTCLSLNLDSLFKSRLYQLCLTVWCWQQIRAACLLLQDGRDSGCIVPLLQSVQRYRSSRHGHPAFYVVLPLPSPLTSICSSAAQEWLWIHGWTQVHLLREFSSSFIVILHEDAACTGCQSALHSGLLDPSCHWPCFKCPLTSVVHLLLASCPSSIWAANLFPVPVSHSKNDVEFKIFPICPLLPLPPLNLFCSMSS